jgi:putative transposase
MASPRKTLKRYDIPHQPRFLTFSCYRRLPLFNNDHIKSIFLNQLITSRDRHRFLLHAWVIMPEHVHLLLTPSPTGGKVTQFLHHLKRPVARRVLHRWRQLDAPILTRIADTHDHPHFWQPGGGYDRNLITPKAFEEKFN